MGKEYSEKISRLLSYFEGFASGFNYATSAHKFNVITIINILTLFNPLSEENLRSCFESSVISPFENSIEIAFLNSCNECLQAMEDSKCQS